MGALYSMWSDVVQVGANVAIAIVVLIFGWLIAKIATKIIKKALKLTNVIKWDDKINEIEIVEG